MVRAMIATTSGACSSRLCFWSMKRAVLPETSTVARAGRGEVADLLHRVLGGAAEGRFGEGEVGVGDVA